MSLHGYGKKWVVEGNITKKGKKIAHDIEQKYAAINYSCELMFATFDIKCA